MQRIETITQQAKVSLTTTMPGGWIGKASGTATIIKSLENGAVSKVEIRDIQLKQIEGGVLFAYLTVLGNAVIDQIDAVHHLAHLQAAITLCDPKYYLMATQMAQAVEQSDIPYHTTSDESHVEAEFTTYISNVGGQVKQKIVADVVSGDTKKPSFTI